MLSNGVPEDKRGCSDKGVDLFSNNVLIISRLLKVDCDMGQTRWNANLPSEIQTKISLCYTFNLIKTVNTFRLFISRGVYGKRILIPFSFIIKCLFMS